MKQMEVCHITKEIIMSKENKNNMLELSSKVSWSETAFLKLKAAVDEFAASLNIEVGEIPIMCEHTEVYKTFGEAHAAEAAELVKHYYYSGEDLRVSLISVVGWARRCNRDFVEVEFWEDTAMIISLIEALEEDFHPRPVRN